MKIEIKLNNNMISASIIIEPQPPEGLFAFELYYFGRQKAKKTCIKRSPYASSLNVSFAAVQSGYYYVRGYYQNAEGVRCFSESNSVLYLNPEFRHLFDETMQKDLQSENTINHPIDYWKAPSPQNDFCLISFLRGHSLFKRGHGIREKELTVWTDSHDFAIRKIRKNGWNTENWLLYDISGKQPGLAKEKYVFSGYAFDESSEGKRFFFGEEHLPPDFDPLLVKDALGAFSLFYDNGNSLILTTDFFGYNSLFVYMSDRFMICANVYHLLLFCLRFIEEKKTLNEDSIIADFASNVTFFRQPVCSELTITNTIQLPLTKDIVIDREGWHIRDREIAQILNHKPKFDRSLYTDLIHKGRDELISNMRAILSAKSFDYFVLELSGGKDSRCNLAAATNVEGARDKVHLYTDDIEPGDLKIGVGIQHLFSFPFDSSGREYILDDPLRLIEKKRSYFCGTRYLWYIPEVYSGNNPQLVINGECFESLAVRYYSSTILKLVQLDSSEEDVISAYASLISKQPMISWNEASKVTCARIADALAMIPGSSPLEKFDNHYMFFRARITAGNLDRGYYGLQSCMPLQSKALVLAKKLWINNYRQEKVIFDITYALNPLLSAIPYNSQKYNLARREMYQELLLEDERFRDCEITLNEDCTEYEAAKKERTNSSRTIKASTYRNRGNIDDLVYENCMLGIKKLAAFQNGRFREQLCLPLFYYILAERNDDVEVRLVHNKINSLLDCIDACGLNYL